MFCCYHCPFQNCFLYRAGKNNKNQRVTNILSVSSSSDSTPLTLLVQFTSSLSVCLFFSYRMGRLASTVGELERGWGKGLCSQNQASPLWLSFLPQGLQHCLALTTVTFQSWLLSCWAFRWCPKWSTFFGLTQQTEVSKHVCGWVLSYGDLLIY